MNQAALLLSNFVPAIGGALQISVFYSAYCSQYYQIMLSLNKN